MVDTPSGDPGLEPGIGSRQWVDRTKVGEELKRIVLRVSKSTCELSYLSKALPSAVASAAGKDGKFKDDRDEFRPNLLRREEPTLVIEERMENALEEVGVSGRDASVVPLEQKDGLVPNATSFEGGKVIPKVVTCSAGMAISSVFLIHRDSITNNNPCDTMASDHITKAPVRIPATFWERSRCLVVNQISATPLIASVTALKPAPRPGSSQTARLLLFLLCGTVLRQ